MRTRAVHRCGYHRDAWGAKSTHTSEMRAKEHAIQSIPVVLLVAQVSTTGLGKAGAKNEASPRPTEATKVGAPHAAGSTKGAERSGSGRPVPAPRRSAPLTSAHNCTKLPLLSVLLGWLNLNGLSHQVTTQSTRCGHLYYPSVENSLRVPPELLVRSCHLSIGIEASRTMLPLGVPDVHKHTTECEYLDTRPSFKAPERNPHVSCAAVSHICHNGPWKLPVKPHATTALNQAKRGGMM
jgi:hypothetical protein